MDLKTLRNEIDVLDSHLLEILNKRMALSLKLKKYKTNIEDKQREQDVLEHFANFPDALFSKEFSINILKEILNESKRVQGKR